MNTRYFAQVAHVSSSRTEVIINAGTKHGVKEGMRFLVIGIGPEIIDPVSGATLEPLEIVRGKAIVKHVQESIATLESTSLEEDSTRREITHKGNRGLSYGLGLGALYGGGDRVEVIKEGRPTLKPFDGAAVGDQIIKL